VKVTGTKVAKGFIAALVIRNVSGPTAQPWTLSWTFQGDQKVTAVVGGSYTQHGHDVTVTSAKLQPKLGPGKTAAVVVTGKGQASAPWLFFLNGKACTTS
jgi:endoglucanase